jgi:hypothetical protein
MTPMWIDVIHNPQSSEYVVPEGATGMGPAYQATHSLSGLVSFISRYLLFLW